jgi:hypothetical protein
LARSLRDLYTDPLQLDPAYPVIYLRPVP